MATLNSGARTDTPSQRQWMLVHRVGLSLVGSYLFCWALTAFGIAASVGLDVDFHEADTASRLLAFVVYMPLFFWAFVARNLLLVWSVLVGGAVIMLAAAVTIQHALLIF